MTFAPEHRSYNLENGQRITIQFFANEVRFYHVLKDHLFSDGQESKKVDEPWERPLSVNFLKKLRQKVGSQGVSSLEDREFLEEAYREVTEALADGIDFSVSFPIYVAFSQERVNARVKEPYISDGYYFLAWDGYLIIVRENIVRTAYFNCATLKPVGRKELVNEALKYLSTLGYAWKIDSKGSERYIHTRLEYYSIENWQSVKEVCKKWPKKRPITV